MKKIQIVFNAHLKNQHCFLCAAPSRYSFVVGKNTNTYYSCGECHAHFAGNSRFELKFLDAEEKKRSA